MSGTQIAALLFLTTVSTVNLFIPASLAQQAGESAWLVPLIIPPLVAYIVLLLAFKLHQRFPRLTLPQYSLIILGKYLGKFVGLLYIGEFWIPIAQ